MSAKGRTSWGKRLAGEDPITGLTPCGLSNKALHMLRDQEYGRASEHPCELEDETCSPRTVWANISGQYLSVEDFMALCDSHHIRFDMTPDRSAKAAATHVGSRRTPEQRAKISASVKDAMTSEVRFKISQAARARTPEQLARIKDAAAAARTPESQARGGLAASHKRWHVKRGIVNPECSLCVVRQPGLLAVVARVVAIRRVTLDREDHS
jgi:hypothetical protein